MPRACQKTGFILNDMPREPLKPFTEQESDNPQGAGIAQNGRTTGYNR